MSEQRHRRARASAGAYKSTSVSLSPSQIAQLDRLAELRGLSRSAVMGELLEKGLRRAWAAEVEQDAERVPA